MTRPTSARLLSILLALTATAGCGSTDPSGLGVADLLVKTDKSVYSLSVDAEARVIEQWSENGWINRSPWFTVDGADVSFPVAPGDSLTSPPMSFWYVNRRAGTYRFVFEVALDRVGSHLIPEEQRASQPFEVTW
jgi:hypothetical protein